MTDFFSNLPIDVLERVLEKSTLPDYLVLRKVSHSLQDYVDSTELVCERIELWSNHSFSEIKFDNMLLEYEATDDGGCMVTSYREDTKKTKTYRDDRNYNQVTITDLGALLCNSKLKIDTLWLDVESTETWTEFLKFLKSLKTLLNVQSIESNDLKHLHSILPFLNQEKLEEIGFCDLNFNVARFNEIVKTDASALLKNPKLEILHMKFGEYSDESAAQFLENLESLGNQLNFGDIKIEKEEWIHPTLRSLNPESFEEIRFDFLAFTVNPFNEICRMGEDWKKKMSLMRCEIPEEIGIENLLHVETFYVSYRITDANLVIVRDILLKSPHFKYCRIQSKNDRRSLEVAYEQIDRIMSENPNYDAQTHQMSIANSNFYFRLSVGQTPGLNFNITRVTKKINI